MYFRWAKFKIADWHVLDNYLSVSIEVDVIPFRLELCFVFIYMLHKHVIRKFKSKVNWPHQNDFSSFDGETFKTEASTKFPHYYVKALGPYRNSPFVTGHSSETNGLKTEILNYGSEQWEQAGDYPFSSGDRYVSKDFMKSYQKFTWKEDDEKTISFW